MVQQHTRVGRFQTSIGGLVLGSITLAYFLGPLLRFVSPGALAWGGLLLGMGLFAIYQVAIVTTLDRNLRWIGFLLSGMGVVFLIIAFSTAMVNSRDFDRKCAELQKMMLSGRKPSDDRPSAHDVFDALACRPQM